jgi:hypothetical protein
MTSALDRILAANDKAREPIKMPHRGDPTIVVTYRPLDPDDAVELADVPMTDDRRIRQAATLLAGACIAIQEIGEDGQLVSIHPDGETVTFESAWLATGLGVVEEDWTAEEVVRRFYPGENDVVLTAHLVQRRSGMQIPTPL